MKLDELKCIDENIDFDEFLEFYYSIKNNMDNSNWLGNFSIEKLNNIFALGGKIWMYKNEYDFVCCMMFIPADQESLRLFNLNYVSTDVGECGPIMVASKYRGNRLQSQMLEVLDDFCKQKNYKYILTTVHPDNVCSIKNFQRCNYDFISTVTLKRGDRAVYLKTLK